MTVLRARGKSGGTSGGAKSGRARRLRGWLVVLGAAFVLAAIAIRFELSFDAPSEFYEQKGQLVEARLEAASGDSAYLAHSLTLVSSAGYTVRGHLRVPRAAGRWPGIIVIGGVNTGRMAAELIDPEEPRIILGLDYPWEGPTRLSWWQFLLRVGRVRRAMLLTPSAVMLAADYLETRDDVTPEDLTFVGASFGAQLMAVAGALDTRACVVLLAYGGGDYEALLAANLRVEPAWLRRSLAWTGAELLAPLAPTDYVGRIAPRRTILINGQRDERTPRHTVEALYEAAGEPKQLIWLDAGHISSRQPETIERVLRAAVKALAEPDDESAGNE